MTVHNTAEAKDTPKSGYISFETAGALGLAAVAIVAGTIYSKYGSAPSIVSDEYSGDKGCLVGTPYAEANGAKTLPDSDVNGNELVTITPGPQAGELPTLVFDVDRLPLIGFASVEPTHDTEALLPSPC